MCNQNFTDESSVKHWRCPSSNYLWKIICLWNSLTCIWGLFSPPTPIITSRVAGDFGESVPHVPPWPLPALSSYQGTKAPFVVNYRGEPENQRQEETQKGKGNIWYLLVRRQWHRLENPMDWGAWKAAVHGVSKSRTRLSDFTFTFHFHALEKEMATHSSVLAWRIPGTGEPGRLPSMGSHRVGHDWSDLAAAAAAVVSNLLLRKELTLKQKHLRKTRRQKRMTDRPCGCVWTSGGAWVQVLCGLFAGRATARLWFSFLSISCWWCWKRSFSFS